MYACSATRRNSDKRPTAAAAAWACTLALLFVAAPTLTHAAAVASNSSAAELPHELLRGSIAPYLPAQDLVATAQSSRAVRTDLAALLAFRRAQSLHVLQFGRDIFTRKFQHLDPSAPQSAQAILADIRAAYVYPMQNSDAVTNADMLQTRRVDTAWPLIKSALIHFTGANVRLADVIAYEGAVYPDLVESIYEYDTDDDDDAQLALEHWDVQQMYPEQVDPDNDDDEVNSASGSSMGSSEGGFDMEEDDGDGSDGELQDGMHIDIPPFDPHAHHNHHWLPDGYGDEDDDEVEDEIADAPYFQMFQQHVPHSVNVNNHPPGQRGPGYAMRFNPHEVDLVSRAVAGRSIRPDASAADRAFTARSLTADQRAAAVMQVLLAAGRALTFVHEQREYSIPVVAACRHLMGDAVADKHALRGVIEAKLHAHAGDAYPSVYGLNADTLDRLFAAL